MLAILPNTLNPAWSPDGKILVTDAINGLTFWNPSGGAAPNTTATQTMVVHAILDVNGSVDSRAGTQWKFSTTSLNVTISVTLTKPMVTCPISVWLVNGPGWHVFEGIIQPGTTNFTASVPLQSAGSYTVVIGSSNRSLAVGCTGTESYTLHLTLTSDG